MKDTCLSSSNRKIITFSRIFEIHFDFANYFEGFLTNLAADSSDGEVVFLFTWEVLFCISS